MRRASKVDSNQPDIVAAFRRLGYSVAHTHMIGRGFPDIVIGKHNRNFLVEIKDGRLPPSKRKLTPDELEFHESWRGQIVIIESIEDVLNFDKATFGQR